MAGEIGTDERTRDARAFLRRRTDAGENLRDQRRKRLDLYCNHAHLAAHAPVDPALFERELEA
jgi:hypothetical protein